MRTPVSIAKRKLVVEWIHRPVVVCKDVCNVQFFPRHHGEVPVWLLRLCLLIRIAPAIRDCCRGQLWKRHEDAISGVLRSFFFLRVWAMLFHILGQAREEFWRAYLSPMSDPFQHVSKVSAEAKSQEYSVHPSSSSSCFIYTKRKITKVSCHVRKWGEATHGSSSMHRRRRICLLPRLGYSRWRIVGIICKGDALDGLGLRERALGSQRHAKNEIKRGVWKKDPAGISLSLSLLK